MCPVTEQEALNNAFPIKLKYHGEENENKDVVKSLDKFMDDNPKLWEDDDCLRVKESLTEEATLGDVRKAIGIIERAGEQDEAGCFTFHFKYEGQLKKIEHEYVPLAKLIEADEDGFIHVYYKTPTAASREITCNVKCTLLQPLTCEYKDNFHKPEEMRVGEHIIDLDDVDDETVKLRLVEGELVGGNKLIIREFDLKGEITINDGVNGPEVVCDDQTWELSQGIVTGFQKIDGFYHKMKEAIFPNPMKDGELNTFKDEVVSWELLNSALEMSSAAYKDDPKDFLKDKGYDGEPLIDQPNTNSKDLNFLMAKKNGTVYMSFCGTRFSSEEETELKKMVEQLKKDSENLTNQGMGLLGQCQQELHEFDVNRKSDIAADIDVGPTDCPEICQGQGIKFHNGFVERFIRGKPAMLNKLNRCCQNAEQNDFIPDTIVVTGHSLGAAVSSLAFIWLKRTLEDHRTFGQSNVVNITFALPLFGNIPLKRHLEENGYAQSMHHFVKSTDIIPAMPFVGHVLKNVRKMIMMPLNPYLPQQLKDAMENPDLKSTDFNKKGVDGLVNIGNYYSLDGSEPKLHQLPTDVPFTGQALTDPLKIILNFGYMEALSLFWGGLDSSPTATEIKANHALDKYINEITAIFKPHEEMTATEQAIVLLFDDLSILKKRRILPMLNQRILPN